MTEKGEPSESVKVLRVRPKAYATGAICVVIMAVVQVFLGCFNNNLAQWPFSVDPYIMVWYQQINLLFFWPLVLCFIFSLMPKSFLTRQEISIVITMVWLTTLIPTGYGVLMWVNWLGAGRWYSPWDTYIRKYIPPVNYLYGPDIPDDALWYGFYYGGRSIPWGSWTLPIVFITLWETSQYLSYMLVGNLLRRQWNEVEALPYPFASGGAALISAATDRDSRPKLLRGNFLRFLGLGIIIGIVTTFPIWAWAFVPGMPQPSVPCPPLGIDLTAQGILPWVPMIFSVEPYFIGAAYFVPSDILLSYVVFVTIIWFILPPIFTGAGIWDPYPGGYTGYSIYWTLNRIYTGPIGLANFAEFFRATWAYFGIGSIFALIAWPMTIHRGEVARYIKAIFKAKPEDFEEREPMRVRSTVLFLIITCLIWAACIIIGGNWLSFPNAGFYLLLIPIIGFFGILWQGVALARVTAEFGMPLSAWAGHVQTVNQWQPFGWWWYHREGAPWYTTDFRVRNMIMFSTFSGSNAGGGYCGRGGFSTPYVLEAYRIGELTGTRANDQFRGFLIGIPLAILTGLVFFLYMLYTFGATKTLKYGMLGWPQNIATRYNFYTEAFNKTWFIILDPRPTMYVAFFIGGLIVVILSILRARFPRFPLIPAALPLAFTYMGTAMLFPCIIAYLARYLTIRVGGAEAYNEKGVPFAIGLIAAINIMSIILSIRNAYVAFTIG